MGGRGTVPWMGGGGTVPWMGGRGTVPCMGGRGTIMYGRWGDCTMYGRGTIIRMGKFAHLIESLLKIKQQINKRKEQEHTKLDAKYNY